MNCGSVCCNSNICMSFVGSSSSRMRLRGFRITPHCAGNATFRKLLRTIPLDLSEIKKTWLHISFVIIFVTDLFCLEAYYEGFQVCICLLCRDEKIAIMREKHSALMRPVVFALDHVCSITAATAETPHEVWFQQTYGSDIIFALERLRNPTNPANPASSWLPFKQVIGLYILLS